MLGSGRRVQLAVLVGVATAGAALGVLGGVALSAPNVPGAPTMGTATAGLETATVSWSAPTSDGGSPVTGYEVTYLSDSDKLASVTFGTAATTQTIAGLTGGTTYRFWVAAVNAAGRGGYSGPSNSAAVASLPGSPIIGGAVAGDSGASVSWAAPSSDGGSPITGYSVTPYIGYFPLPPRIFVSTATTQVIDGLANGTQYRFRVQALNSVGVGSYSKATNPVVPYDQSEAFFGGFSNIQTSGSNPWTANLRVRVNDAHGNGLEGLTVTGTWTYTSPAGVVTTVDATCNQTSDTGTCQFQLGQIPNLVTTVTFTMTGISGGVPPVVYSGGTQVVDVTK